MLNFKMVKELSLLKDMILRFRMKCHKISLKNPQVSSARHISVFVMNARL
jgi:hypothetical protein